MVSSSSFLSCYAFDNLPYGIPRSRIVNTQDSLISTGFNTNQVARNTFSFDLICLLIRLFSIMSCFSPPPWRMGLHQQTPYFPSSAVSCSSLYALPLLFTRVSGSLFRVLLGLLHFCFPGRHQRKYFLVTLCRFSACPVQRR